MYALHAKRVTVLERDWRLAMRNCKIAQKLASSAPDDTPADRGTTGSGTPADAREAVRNFVGVNPEELLDTVRAEQAEFTERGRQRCGLADGEDVATELNNLFNGLAGPTVDQGEEARDDRGIDVLALYEG